MLRKHNYTEWDGKEGGMIGASYGERSLCYYQFTVLVFEL